MNWIAFTAIGGWIFAIVGVIWKGGQMSGFINEIRNNHLPHIYKELQYLRERMDNQHGPKRG